MSFRWMNWAFLSTVDKLSLSRFEPTLKQIRFRYCFWNLVAIFATAVVAVVAAAIVIVVVVGVSGGVAVIFVLCLCLCWRNFSVRFYPRLQSCASIGKFVCLLRYIEPLPHQIKETNKTIFCCYCCFLQASFWAYFGLNYCSDDNVPIRTNKVSLHTFLALNWAAFVVNLVPK